jgi:hypothetical protein
MVRVIIARLSHGRSQAATTCDKRAMRAQVDPVAHLATPGAPIWRQPFRGRFVLGTA